MTNFTLTTNSCRIIPEYKIRNNIFAWKNTIRNANQQELLTLNTPVDYDSIDLFISYISSIPNWLFVLIEDKEKFNSYKNSCLTNKSIEDFETAYEWFELNCTLSDNPDLLLLFNSLNELLVFGLPSSNMFIFNRTESINKIVSLSSYYFVSVDQRFLTARQNSDIFKYEIDGLEVYSAIPKQIVESFSFVLNIDKLVNYTDQQFADIIFTLDKKKYLHVSNKADLVFSNFLEEECNNLLSSSEKFEIYYIKSPTRSSASLKKEVLRKTQAKKLCSIFPVITKMQILDPETLEFKEINYLRIKINNSKDIFDKYTSAKDYLQKIVEFFLNKDPLAWSDPETYQKNLLEKFKNFSCYNSSLITLMLQAQLEPDKIKLPEVKNSVNIDKTKLTYYQAASNIYTSENFSNLENAYNELIKKKENWQTEEQDLKNAITHAKSNLSRWDVDLEYHKRSIERLNDYKKKDEEILLQSENKIVTLLNNIESIKEPLETLKIQYEETKKNNIDLILDSAKTIEVPWIDKIQNSNIQLTNCMYTLPIFYNESFISKFAERIKFKIPVYETDSITPLYDLDSYANNISIQDFPKIAFYAKEKLSIPFDELFTIIDEDKEINIDSKMLIPILTEINFSTLRPSIIKVDGNSNKQIVAGPFDVTVKSGHSRNGGFYPSLTLNLKDQNSVFGYKQTTQSNLLDIKIHPHTGSRSLQINKNMFSNLVRERSNGCLGDAQPALYKAFETSNILNVLFAAKAWIESANSNDTWGRDWKIFPKVEDISFDSNPVVTQEITETEVDDMLHSLLEQATNIENVVTNTEETTQTLRATPELPTTVTVGNQEFTVGPLNYNQTVTPTLNNLNVTEPINETADVQTTRPIVNYRTYAELINR